MNRCSWATVDSWGKSIAEKIFFINICISVESETFHIIFVFGVGFKSFFHIYRSKNKNTWCTEHVRKWIIDHVQESCRIQICISDHLTHEKKISLFLISMRTIEFKEVNLLGWRRMFVWSLNGTRNPSYHKLNPFYV